MYHVRLSLNKLPLCNNYPEEAARRVYNDNRQSEKYDSPEEALKKLTERKNIEIKRLKDRYSLDYSDLDNYDLIMDTTGKTPEEVCEQIIDSLIKDRSLGENIYFVNVQANN